MSPETSLLRKRAALWTIGHIGSSEYGFQLIQEADILKIIVDLAENAEILSIRGLVIEILILILERQYMCLDWFAQAQKEEEKFSDTTGWALIARVYR